MAMPEYVDGVLEIRRIVNDESEDYPEEKLERIGLKVWYRELSVYDTTRAKLSADSVEVTMKLAIPRFKGVDSKCVCIIDGEQHEVYNVAHTTTKDGFRESELTLKTPAYEREVINDTETIKSFAYGLSAKEISDNEGTSLEVMEKFAEEHAAEIEQKKAELKEGGWYE